MLYNSQTETGAPNLPTSGFINPVLKPVTRDGEIVGVEIEYPDDFTAQMLYYAKEYSFLPTYN